MITAPLSSFYDKILLHTDGDVNDPKYLLLRDALNRIASGSFGGILAQINQFATKPLYITADAWDPRLLGQGSITAMVDKDGSPKPPYVHSGHFIYIDPAELGGLNVQGFGSDFHASLDRILYHELIHVVENLNELDEVGNITLDEWKSSQLSIGTTVGEGIDFSEEVAVFGENFIYASDPDAATSDRGMRLGHAKAEHWTPATDLYNEEGATGMAGFIGSQIFRTFVDGGDTFTFRAQHASGLVSKTYHKPGYDLFNNDSPLTTYDHYIRYETSGGYISFADPAAVSKPAHVTAVLPDIMFDSREAAFRTVANEFSVVQHLFDAFQSAPGIGAVFVRGYARELGLGSYGTADVYQDMFVTRMVGIGADRWGDVPADAPSKWVDLSGPVQTGTAYPVGDVLWPGTTISANRLAINDQASSLGAVLLGGSGYVLKGSALAPASNFVDATASSDWLVAGSGNDVIIMGTGGRNAANANFAYGNDGRDMLIGRDGIDNLFGGNDDDIFSPGGGADYIVGGAGIDTLSYYESATGVSLNLATQTGSSGDAAGDSWRGVEKFIGSKHDDTFVGVGGSFMAGMEGNDVFHLKAGDVAFGGAGADSFYVEAVAGQPISVGIVDLDPSDRIYVNGTLFQGWSLYSDGKYYSATMSGYVVYDGDRPDYPLLPETLAKISFTPMSFSMYDPPSTSALDIYIAGYTAGDGGLSMSPARVDIPFPFHPVDLV